MTTNGPPLFPLYHECGAIALYSKVPVERGQRVPAVKDLLLADGRTPLHSPFLLHRRPKAPLCQQCGQSTLHTLKSQPPEN